MTVLLKEVDCQSFTISQMCGASERAGRASALVLSFGWIKADSSHRQVELTLAEGWQSDEID